MRLHLFKSKIHRATVTHADLDYEGSITLSGELMDAANILPHEQVHVWNVTRGTRLVTYTRTPAWNLGHGEPVASVDGYVGGISLDHLDIDPTRPPTPLLTIPVLALAGSAIAVAVVVVLAALYAQRSADRADVSEVLRLGS